MVCCWHSVFFTIYFLLCTGKVTEYGFLMNHSGMRPSAILILWLFVNCFHKILGSLLLIFWHWLPTDFSAVCCSAWLSLCFNISVYGSWHSPRYCFLVIITSWGSIIFPKNCIQLPSFQGNNFLLYIWLTVNFSF